MNVYRRRSQLLVGNVGGSVVIAMEGFRECGSSLITRHQVSRIGIIFLVVIVGDNLT